MQLMPLVRPRLPIDLDDYTEVATEEFDVAELQFASRAVLYLEKQGLDEEAVIKCLIEELELDRDTAEALAKLAA